MNTILPRLKTMLIDNKNQGGVLSYVPSIEIIHPDLILSTITKGNLPKICIFPDETAEAWAASQRKSAVNIVWAYLILQYEQRETSIVGDTSRPGVQGKGIVPFVTDFIGVVRGTRLSVNGANYLDKPLDITNIKYIVQRISEDGHVMIASIRMSAQRLFSQVTLPGDV